MADRTTAKRELESQSPVSQRAMTRKKLTGREFYESIGSPKLILAPMVDRSEFAWRLLTRSFMKTDVHKPLLAYSPMFHARLFAENPKHRDQYFQPTRDGFRKETESQTAKPFLDGNPFIDRPLFVQFCANDPDELLAAARFVEPYCDAVDLNLGCPQGIARKGNYGAFLQEDWDLIYSLINKLHNELSIPVTAKLRILESKEKTLEYAKKILSAGASIISVHGRRREQKGHNTGVADWSYIRYLRDNLPPETVMFCNGNILSHTDIQACLEATGVDGVMSAEGNLSDPTIFALPPGEGEHNPEYWRGRDGQGGYRVDAIFRRYMDIIYKYVLERDPPTRPPLLEPQNGNESLEFLQKEDSEDATLEPPLKKRKKDDPKRNSPSLRPMQGHLFALLRQLVSRHTDIRDALAKCLVGDMDAFERVLNLVERAVAKGISEYEQNVEYCETAARQPKEKVKDKEDEKGSLESSSSTTATVAKYKRPWWVCQPHIRPLPSEAFEIGAMQLSKKQLTRLGKEGKEGKERTTPIDVPESSTAAEKGVGEITPEIANEVPREAVVCG